MIRPTRILAASVLALAVPACSLGGLVGGAICGLIVVAGERGMLGPRRLQVELIAMGVVAILALVGSLVVA